ncbi:helix-hairpin-helix domain-containing protein [Peribacillus kribbensis]|uniref:helix-hairpin-helix domain-containing protein n=1 Tax=Peribacillus kribbensis TaxID=356658 RepID=UPI000420D8F3|nr:helix-hairpin-helix domain-containing protein [Peribacillus kribbensis]
MEKLLSNKKIWIIGSVVLLFLALAVFKGGLPGGEQKHAELESLDDKPLQMAKEDLPADKQEQAPPGDIMVDVKGAVQKTGVYKALPGERVIDIITKAGGFKPKADKDKVNLAQAVSDQMVIFVPEIGAEIPGGMGSSVAAAGPVSDSQSGGAKVNINSADLEELQTLTGIGPSKAQAIMDYRNKNGSFKSPEDLKNISGIGEKTFEKIKDMIAVQ